MKAIKWSTLLFVIGLASWCLFLSGRLIYNWDIGPYIACVLQWEGKEDPSDGADQTAIVLLEECGEERFQQLTRGEEARGKNLFYSNSQTYNQLIQYYLVRPLYVASMYICHQIGFSYTASSVVPNLLAFFFFGLFFAFWMKKVLPDKPALLMAFLCLLFPAVSNIARFSTPDGLSNLLLLILSYLFLEKKGKPMSVLLLICSLAILARIDNLIFCLLLLIYQITKDLAHSKKAVSGIAGSVFLIILALLIIPLAVGIDWDWFRSLWFASERESYLIALAHALWKFLYHPLSLFLAIFVFLSAFVKDSGLASRKGVLIVCFFGFILIKAVVHPGFAIRHYAFIFVISFLLLCQWMYDRRHSDINVPSP